MLEFPASTGSQCRPPREHSSSVAYVPATHNGIISKRRRSDKRIFHVSKTFVRIALCTSVSGHRTASPYPCADETPKCDRIKSDEPQMTRMVTDKSRIHVPPNHPCGVPRFWSPRRVHAFSAECCRTARFVPGVGLANCVAPRAKTRPCRGLQNLQNRGTLSFGSFARFTMSPAIDDCALTTPSC